MAAKAGILSNLADWKVPVLELPVGAVAGGAVVGGVGDALAGLVTGFVPGFPSWAVKGVVAAAIIRYGPNVVGDAVAALGGLFLTYDAVQELVNIRGSTRNIVGGITGKIVTKSPPVLTGAGVDQLSTGYYPGVAGRQG